MPIKCNVKSHKIMLNLMELIIHSIIMAVIGNTCQNAIIISDKIKWQNLMLTIGKTNIERQFSAKKKKKK